MLEPRTQVRTHAKSARYPCIQTKKVDFTLLQFKKKKSINLTSSIWNSPWVIISLLRTKKGKAKKLGELHYKFIYARRLIWIHYLNIGELVIDRGVAFVLNFLTFRNIKLIYLTQSCDFFLIQHFSCCACLRGKTLFVIKYTLMWVSVLLMC